MPPTKTTKEGGTIITTHIVTTATQSISTPPTRPHFTKPLVFERHLPPTHIFPSIITILALPPLHLLFYNNNNTATHSFFGNFLFYFSFICFISLYENNLMIDLDTTTLQPQTKRCSAHLESSQITTANA